MGIKKKHVQYKYGPLIIGGSLLLISVLCYFIFPGFEFFIDKSWKLLWTNDEQAIADHYSSYGLLGPLLIIAFMVVQMFLLVFPTWLPMIVAMLAYGPVWGSVISLAAVVVASIIGYWIGYTMGPSFLNRVLSEKKLKILRKFVRKYGFGAVVLFRISPILSNDAISFVAGMTKMRFWRYIGATVIGIIPLIISIAMFGKNTETLKDGMIWIGIGGVILYGLYIWLKWKMEIRKKKKRKN